jgi:hypothetical protein
VIRRGAAAVALVAAGLALVTAAPARAALPVINYTLNGPTGGGDWFRGPVTLKWTVTGETSSSGCDTVKLTADTTGTQRSCSASNDEGPITATTRPIRIDQVAPVGVTALPSRPADASGWYTSPLPINWSGTDATSGIASCTTMTFAGPDAPTATPAGSCRDNAGNESGAVSLTFPYDSTPPALSGVSATAGPGAATVRWTPGPDVQHVTVTRVPGDAEGPSKVIADGPQAATDIVDRGLVGGTSYSWTVAVRDAAGNTTTDRASATPPVPVEASTIAPVLGAATPADRAKVLRWRARPGATYYNFQLLRKSQKILSAWPSKARYRLRPSWQFRGRRHRLVRGVYAWYVWPGYGPRQLRRYGRLLAHGTFRVR